MLSAEKRRIFGIELPDPSSRGSAESQVCGQKEAIAPGRTSE